MRNYKTALITGITGQDGSYLAEFLLSKGYEVHGIFRKGSTPTTQRLSHLLFGEQQRREIGLFLHYGDMLDSSSLNKVIDEVKPDEIYNLAAQTHVGVSFEIPEYTAEVDGIGVLRMLETIKKSGLKIKLYQASTSELFGNARETPQGETTSLCPKSPYGVAKLYAYWIGRSYRESYNLFICNGILFNHESPRRGEGFVSRKTTKGITSILTGEQEYLCLGNLDTHRDWGYAPEYVESMWKMLQQNEPEDFVIGTEESHSVKEFIAEAFSYAGLNQEKYVKVDQKYFRPADVNFLIADSTKAREKLGWTPKIKFKELVKIMVDADMRAVGLKPVGEGDRIVKEKFPSRWWGAD